MVTEIKKLRDLEYDVRIALGVIEKEPDLLALFTDEVKMSFNLVITLAKENKLSDSTKDLIKELFDKVILTKANLIDKYLQLASNRDKTLDFIEPIPSVEPLIVVEEKPIKPKKVKALPRRYGKVEINKDIARQGGKPTNPQLAALEVNDLKNIYVVLSTKLINDMLTDNPILTDEDYRTIRASIGIIKNKLKILLKKK